MATVWLASYPKSGNTWLRMMIGALAVPDGAEVDINALPERGGIASNRSMFDYHTLIDSSLLTYDEIDRLRPAVHAPQRDERDETGEPAGAVRFAKTHDAYVQLPDGAPLLGGRQAARGAVLIVRDPRDVAASLANHVGLDLDQAIARMCDRDDAFCAQPDRLASQLRQRLLGWSGFAESWLAQTDLPLITLRYEDMQDDSAAALGRVMEFAGDPRPADCLARAAELTRFDRLRRQEAERGFREAPSRAKVDFFRRGQAGVWKDELSPGQVARIELAHGATMDRLGYGLAATTG